MGVEKLLLCPICNNKTRTKLREDTVLLNFLLFCPKCKQETLVNVQNMNMSVMAPPTSQYGTTAVKIGIERR